MIIFNVNRFFFNFAFFALLKLFWGLHDFFSTFETFFEVWAIFHFSTIYPIFWLFFSNFFCFSIFRRISQFCGSVLHLESFFRKFDDTSTSSDFLFKIVIFNIYRFFQQCILNRISESSSIFFDDFFQHQNLLSELDSFSFFNNCFIFFTITFPFFNAFSQLFFAFPSIWNCLNYWIFLLWRLVSKFGTFLHKIVFFSINEKLFFQNLKLFKLFNAFSNFAGCFHFGRSSFVPSKVFFVRLTRYSCWVVFCLISTCVFITL